MKTNATLVLEDGTTLHGSAFGANTDAVFELVFNTSMTGYQEILSDPSYRGQGVLFTVPHLGNVGINEEDHESTRPQISAVVTRQLSPLVSNWRSTQPLHDWLQVHGIPGISEVDTRLLTRKLRDGGTQKAALSTCGTSPEKLLSLAREWPGLDGRDMVQEVSCTQPYTWQEDAGDKWIPSIKNAFLQKQVHLVAYDFGIKHNILRNLSAHNARITVIPASTQAKDVLALKPDGICLGHQLIGRSLGAETRRLKFGHHGGNHPVQHLKNRQAFITAQNHNYCVEECTLDPQLAEITYRSLNDLSVEGLRLKKQPVFSVQYHPEAAPGPHDAHHLFNEFFNLIRGGDLA
jgi:carbamoyl-phosphate synthase small subunit